VVINVIKIHGRKKEDGEGKIPKRKAGKIAAAIAFAGALLASGPMSAKAEEPAPRPPITLKMGAAYDPLTGDVRMLSILGSSLALPARLKLEAVAGLSGSLTTPGQFNVEEAKLDLNAPVAGPVFFDLYGYNSRHFGVRKFSVGADVGVGLPFGAALVGFERILDADQMPVYGVLALDAIRNRLNISVSGGYVTNCDAGTAGLGVRFMVGPGLPALSVHTMAIFNRDAFLFADTRAMVEYEF
jgi:hypothetical protein